MLRDVIRAAFSSFLKGFAFLFGIGCGILFILLAIEGKSSSSSEALRINNDFVPEILPNAQGERKDLGKTAPILLRIDIVGTIGCDKLNCNSIQQQLVESREGILGDRVKGLLLYINSPGGTVAETDAIYRAILDYKRLYRIPIYAYVDGICASGGYYIACAADRILASDTSLIGSVGVLTLPFFNASRLIDKIGVNALTLHAGEGKDDLDPWRPWRAGEQDNIQSIVDSHYDHFVDVVARGRHQMSRDKLKNEYGARVFMAKEAAEHSFIDDGETSLNGAIGELIHAMELKGTPCQIVQMQRQNWLKELFTDRMQVLSGKITHQIDWGDGIAAGLRGHSLYLYRAGE